MLIDPGYEEMLERQGKELCEEVGGKGKRPPHCLELSDLNTTLLYLSLIPCLCSAVRGCLVVRTYHTMQVYSPYRTAPHLLLIMLFTVVRIFLHFSPRSPGSWSTPERSHSYTSRRYATE